VTRRYINNKIPSRLAAFLTVLFCVLRSGTAAFAQGCASCYTTAAAGGSQTVHALRGGILVLLFPPVLIFSGVVLLLLHWRCESSRSPTEKL